MNGQQKAVLWMGLILVALNLASHWPSIKSIIFAGAGITSGIGGSGGSGGGFQFPNPLPFPFNLAGTQKTSKVM